MNPPPQRSAQRASGASGRARAVLWDADGVLQDRTRGLEIALHGLLGDRVGDFLDQTWSEEVLSLRGDASWPEVLPEVLERWNIVSSYDVVLDLWCRLEAHPATFALLEDVRAAGTPCYLGSNQDAYRAAIMDAELGYRDRLDGVFYSFQVGAAKPEAAYCEHVLAVLDLRPAEVLFVDDNAGNVSAARRLGLRAEQWTVADGIDRLHAVLVDHEVLPAAAPVDRQLLSG